ncbi:MAG: Asp-tRNA(Asn)/Glu-tRNA(Gln) amidotransferase subunit GatC [Nitrosarchaeum sp.]
MVSREEIEHVAKLMRIEIDDPTIYDSVDKMIGYFDILDSADVESEEISVREIPITNLREDKYIPFDEKLIEKLNSYKGTYVRAPKMV